MAVVHIPRIRGHFGGVVVPRALFDGASFGLGVFCGSGHADPGAVERDVRRLAKGGNAAFAGKLRLPGGTLLAMEMPDDPAKLFIQLGLTPGEVRDQVNAVNLSDPREEDIVNRWRNFQQLNHRFLDSASDEEKSAFEMRAVELGENAAGALVIETPFGRSFSLRGATHAEWQIAKDGQRKVQGGRASHFLRAFDMQDWGFLARGLVSQLHRFPEQPIGSRDLQRMLDIAHTPSGPVVDMDLWRELIEEQVALVRAGNAVAGRDFAETVSTGFPPHDTRDRTAVRVRKGQYSTPPAVGEVAAEFLKPNGRTIYEPTIGNGVLAAASYGAGGLIYGVEIDPARHGRVGNALPDARVLLADATKPDQVSGIHSALRSDGRFDAVLANPPYASLDEDLGPVRFDHFDLSLPAGKLDTHIAANAVQRLREGGNAVLVMPGNMMKPAEFGAESRRFQVMLNAVFRKVDSVVLDASLYRNMGSNFPVIVHFCEDRRPDGAALDVAEAARLVPERLEVLGTFGAFYERASQIIQESRIEALPLDVADANRATFLGVAAPNVEFPADAGDEPALSDEPATVEGPALAEQETIAGPASPAGGGTVPPSAGKGPRAPREQLSDTTPPQADPEQGGATETGPIHEPSGATELEAPAKMQLREWFIDDFAPDKFTVPYSPRSRKGQTLAVIERTMANETYAALRRIEEAVGKSVDEYVAERMGVPYETFMGESVILYPEQVDSLALSFHRRSTGRATIIGDQMGVGKGIQLAAHAYSSIEIEGRPVLFMTNRANLFSDLCIRDWKNASGKRFLDRVDAGIVRPFIFNADGALRENEKVAFSTGASDRKDAQTNRDLGDANLVMMTYSQVQTAGGLWRHEAIKNWIARNARDGHRPVILLDEAHKAAGDESRTGMVIQDLLNHAAGHDVEIIYSSATSLKSGKNLPVYAPALPDTGLSTSELLLAIEKMPLAMQEVLASEMARDGALIERKMSDAGVERELIVLADIDPERMERTRGAVDRVSELIRELSETGKVIADAAKQQAKQRLGGMVLAGSMDKVRIETTSVASQLDSFSRYLMGSVKGQFVSELLQDAVARGHKPSVVLEYTADSVSEFVIGDQLGALTAASDGVVVAGHPNIGDVVKRFAHKAMTFKAVDGLGNAHEFRVAGFDGWLERFLAEVDDARLEDLRVNVFDRTREAAEALGMTFEDITGRKYEFRTGENGEVRAFLRDKPQTADAVARYNSGQTDILGLNSGSATGVSAQASPAHGSDVRRREMIKLAFQREITDERQVEGRVHRAGQIVPPRYSIPVTGFAPDDRIANLFNRANRSLTSSTSATRENRTNADHAVDILNPVGERAARMVLAKNPQIADMLDIDIEKGQDIARKLLGRSVMLPLAEQSAILSEVDSMFRVISDKMTAEGTNPLRLQFYDWNAKVEHVEDLIPGDPGSRGIAAEPLRLNRVTYEEKVESLSAKTVIGNISDNSRQREEPFENPHKAWSYDKAVVRGVPDFSHHLFGSVMGRVAEGGRHLWPLPLPKEAAAELMHVFQLEINRAQSKLGRSLNGDEFRALSEELGERMLDDGQRRYSPQFASYKASVSDKLKADLRPSSVALALRATWNRLEQVRRLDKVLPHIEPGRLIALDRRALSQVAAGMWGSAYDKVEWDAALVPAVITSARYAVDTPFAESKINFSIFVPGARFVERLSVSSLHSAMEVAGAQDEVPIRPFHDFLQMAKRSEYPSSHKRAMETALRGLMGDDGYAGFTQQIEALSARHSAPDLSEVLSAGLHEREGGVAMLRALCDNLPQQTRKQSRITLEGNLFVGMSAVSNSVASATSGEKVVYTDENGTHHNAILLNNRATEQLVENVKRKVAKRSVIHSGLASEKVIGDYLRLTNAVEFGLHYYDETGRAETMAALAAFYPAAFGSSDTDGFEEAMASVRGQMTSQSGTFPSSIMAGGDIWRWATDLAQKAATASERPRGYIPGMGGPAELSVRVDPDENALGFREVRVNTSYSTHALASAFGDMDRSQAVVLSMRRGEVLLVLQKDHAAFSGPDGGLLEASMQQRLWDAKLKTGLLVGTFDLRDGESRGVVARVLLAGAGGKPELLIGGVLKEVQSALTKEADTRVRAAHRRDLAIEQVQEGPKAREPNLDAVAGTGRTALAGGGYGGP